MGKKLLAAFALGLGLILTTLWLLGTGPVAHAATFSADITNDENDGSCTPGDCSLREAIIAANSNGGADVVALGNGPYNLTIVGTDENAAAGDLDITEALTITGLGPGQTTIDANQIDRVFDIRPGVPTVVISGVTILNGYVTGNGGGIYNQEADLTLINTVIFNNVATGTSGFGGGVYLYASEAKLNMSSGQIVSNTANQGGGGYLFLGQATLSGGQIISNTAKGSWPDGRGGGVRLHQSASAFTQTGGTIEGNQAYHGGGVYAEYGTTSLTGGQIVSNTAAECGGGLHVSAGTATLSGGQIVSNTAHHGGGVCLSGNDASFIQTSGTITHNVATDDGGGAYVGWGRMTLSGGQIISNTAKDDGGGAYVSSSGAALDMTDGQIVENFAEGSGGGVYVYQGDMTLTEGLIAGNTAGGYGGGVHVQWTTASLDASRGQIIGNTAGRGGGIYNSSATVTLVNTTVSGNRATEAGGGIWHNGGTSVLTYTTIASNTASTAGGGIYVGGGAVLVQNTVVAYNGPSNCYGTPTSNGHNLADDDTCDFNNVGDHTGFDPLLGPLTYDGTWVHPLLPGSPAIDNGVCVAGITVDQRGVSRPYGSACDIGAYEHDWRKVYLPLILRNYQ